LPTAGTPNPRADFLAGVAATRRDTVDEIQAISVALTIYHSLQDDPIDCDCGWKKKKKKKFSHHIFGKPRSFQLHANQTLILKNPYDLYSLCNELIRV